MYYSTGVTIISLLLSPLQNSCEDEEGGEGSGVLCPYGTSGDEELRECAEQKWHGGEFHSATERRHQGPALLLQNRE